MIRKKSTAVVFVASVAVSAAVLMLRGKQINFAEMLGGALGLMLFPYLLAYLAKWTCQLFKIRFEERTFNIVFVVGWTFLAAVNLLA